MEESRILDVLKGNNNPGLKILILRKSTSTWVIYMIFCYRLLSLSTLKIENSDYEYHEYLEILQINSILMTIRIDLNWYDTSLLPFIYINDQMNGYSINPPPYLVTGAGWGGMDREFWKKVYWESK